MRTEPLALIRNRRCDRCHLQRRDLHLRLTDCGLQQLTDIPVNAQLIKGLGAGKIAAAVAGFQPERTAETVKALVIQQQINVIQNGGKNVNMTNNGVLTINL